MKYFILLAAFTVSFIFRIPTHAQSIIYKQKKAEQLAGDSPFRDEMAGKLPQRILYRDSLVIVLAGILASAQAPVHLLIIPAKRITSLNEAAEKDENILGHMLLTAKRIAREQGIAESGYRLVINTNEDAGQSAFHLHMHLLGGTVTGAMVEQSWRNVQRAKMAPAVAEYRTPATKDSLLMHLLGKWQYIQMNNHLETNIILQWEPELHFQFIKETYNRIIKDESGKIMQSYETMASYSASLDKNYTAQWSDSDGKSEKLHATGTENSLTVFNDVRNSKTNIVLLGKDSMQLTVFIKKNDNTWQLQDSTILKRVY